jgi:hypothetical protein
MLNCVGAADGAALSGIDRHWARHTRPGRMVKIDICRMKDGETWYSNENIAES